MIDATKANVPSYIERLRKPAGVPPFIQREVADILQWHVDTLEALPSRNEALGSVRCPDNAGGIHRWDGDGQCLDCCNYATDLIDKALQDNKE